MNGPARRLAGFGLVLVVVFASAYAFGEWLPGNGHTDDHNDRIEVVDGSVPSTDPHGGHGG